ncbi:putative chromatin remodeling & transcription regulator BTB-POZ family [Lupinus albus]|uniref:Putative chromatin remodeling & transcription regulator BTB-POZ family n=1 Tax=Lupinus albus TaxID=3870 RepID=A0A6A4PM85_LUPAL|nr:putative chromatin remodeling & transcription regulator BTB-POZ family [Lupinus albus]
MLFTQISSDFSFPQYLHYNSLLLLHATEEAAIIDLLNFIYTNTLDTTSPCAVLDVLMATGKFQVVSCMRYCSRLLQNMPMKPESALLYL